MQRKIGIAEAKPRRTAELLERLPPGIEPGYDGMRIEI